MLHAIWMMLEGLTAGLLLCAAAAILMVIPATLVTGRLTGYPTSYPALLRATLTLGVVVGALLGLGFVLCGL